MRYEVKQDEEDGTQWVIWDNLESRAFARFSDQATAQEIVDKWYAAQLAAEASAG